MNFSTVHSGRTRDPTADVFKAANASLVTSNPNLTATSSITNNNISAGGFDRLVIVQLMCFPVITAAGLIGNILICFAVFRRRRLRITDVFILNLAATDLGTCVISIPFDFAVLLAKQWPFGNVLCKNQIGLCKEMHCFNSTLTLIFNLFYLFYFCYCHFCCLCGIVVWLAVEQIIQL